MVRQTKAASSVLLSIESLSEFEIMFFSRTLFRLTGILTPTGHDSNISGVREVPFIRKSVSVSKGISTKKI